MATSRRVSVYSRDGASHILSVWRVWRARQDVRARASRTGGRLPRLRASDKTLSLIGTCQLQIKCS